jgi:hypothetical protein
MNYIGLKSHKVCWIAGAEAFGWYADNLCEGRNDYNNTWRAHHRRIQWGSIHKSNLGKVSEAHWHVLRSSTYKCPAHCHIMQIRQTVIDDFPLTLPFGKRFRPRQQHTKCSLHVYRVGANLDPSISHKWRTVVRWRVMGYCHWKDNGHHVPVHGCLENKAGNDFASSRTRKLEGHQDQSPKGHITTWAAWFRRRWCYRQSSIVKQGCIDNEIKKSSNSIKIQEVRSPVGSKSQKNKEFGCDDQVAWWDGCVSRSCTKVPSISTEERWPDSMRRSKERIIHFWVVS